MDTKLLEKLEGLEKRFEELNESMADPEVVADREKYKEVTKTYTELKPIVENYREFRSASEELEGSRELLNSGDPEMAEMAGEEVTRLEGRLEELEQELKVLLLPTDPNDARNVVLEIRAGTGGDEATLFAAEMFRMYSRFAESTGWKVETMDVSESAAGGVKEVVAMIEGDRVFSRLKFESGVHRVQRVPETEAQGRVHTSAVTVAVLPEADDVEVEIDEKDIRLDTFCSSGPGGQSVNTTQSAVRITHLPTGLVVQCQDEKSWHKNKAQAMKVLRSRLYDKMVQEQHDEIAKERSSLIGSGDRSEKIRTYNFPQNRVTDHRIKLTVHNLTQVMEGELGNIVEALVSQDRADRLRAEM